MGAERSIDHVVSTLDDLRFQLLSAQQGSMEPLLRAELSRLAFATERCVGKLSESHQQAEAKLGEKKAHVAKLAAANKEAIAAKQAAAAAPPEPPAKAPEPAPIDPTLRTRLTAELLARLGHDNGPVAETQRDGLIDDWPSSSTGLVAEPQLAADPGVGPAVAADGR